MKHVKENARRLGKPLTGGRLGGGSAASAAAEPQAPRSAPAPAPVPPAPPPAHCAATPPAPRAPRMRAGLDRRAHRATTAQDRLAHVPGAIGESDPGSHVSVERCDTDRRAGREEM